jgi:hypothetical protein
MSVPDGVWDDGHTDLGNLARIRRAVQLRVAGQTWDQVAQACGWNSGEAACMAVGTYRRRQRRLTDQAIETLQAEANERLDFLRGQVIAVMLRPHYLYQGGKKVWDEDENGNRTPVLDDGPRLAAIDRYLKIEERAARNNGSDMGDKLEITLARRTEVESAMVTEAILAGMEAAGLEPQLRMQMLEAAAAKLDAIDAEVVEDDGGQPESGS